MAPKPALAKKTSSAPKRSSVAATSACWSSQLGHVAAHGQRVLVAAELLGQRRELVLRARRQHDAVAELHGAARGGGADAGAGAGDHENGFVGHGAGSIRLRSARAMAAPRPDRAPASRPCRRAPATTRASTCKACHPAEPLGRLDPLHGPQAAGRGAQRLALVHAVRRPARARARRRRRMPGARRPAAATGSESGRRASARTARAARSAATRLGADASRRPSRRCSTCRAAWMYRAPLPRTKLLSPLPGGRASAAADASDGRTIERRRLARRWSGHNWGAEHAERWIWLHGASTEAGRLARRGDRRA